MTICNSGRLLSRILEMGGQANSVRAYRSFGRFPRQLVCLSALFCWTLIVIIPLLMVSGCGRYKQELESAKQQIEKLNSEIKRLTGEVAGLSQEKGRLSDDLKTLSDKNDRMQGELDDLNKAKAALFAENKEMKKKNSAAEEEIASLNREKIRLTQEVEELKKRMSEMVPPSQSHAATPTESGLPGAKQPEELSPCDAVIAFMNASEGIVRQQKGAERTKSLERVKEQYAPRMKGAPAKAIKAAENWVKEGAKFWDQSHSDAVFRLLQLRNTVLKACGKSPSGEGFK